MGPIAVHAPNGDRSKLSGSGKQVNSEVCGNVFSVNEEGNGVNLKGE